MSTALDDWITRLVGSATTAEAAVVAADRLVEYRDRVIREARAAGVSAITIAKMTGLARSRIYQVLEGPGPHDDPWDHETFAQEMDDRWTESFYEWERHDHQGDVSDYFPLPEALRDAL